MNWAIGQGYMGLNASVGKREAAKDELSTLAMLDQQMKADRMEQEQAQLKEQAYNEQVSKFSNTLLAPDRDRINEKAKILSVKVRDHIKKYGGNMQKFFENGGHNILGDYKSSIINSEESSIYLENKKNMDMLVKMQMEGKGHLINPNDLQRMKYYQEHGEGEIKYTGALNEIKMPDTEGYLDGEEIPALDILYNEGNYVKIYGNYVTTYPDEGIPNEADLISFVKANYRDKGTNWRKQVALEQAKTDRIKAMNSRSSSKNSTKPGAGPESTGYISKYTSDVSKLLANTEEYMTAADFKQGYWNKYAGQDSLKQVTGGDFTSSAEDYMDRGDGDWSSIYANGYSPRNAQRLNFNKEAVTKALLGESYNIEGGKLKGIELKNTMEWFDAAGVRIKDWTDKTWYGDNDYLQEEENQNKDYDIVDIITIATAKDKNGKDNMIMNRTKSSSNDIDEEETAKMDKAIGESSIKHGAAIVIESEDGHRFYIPFDPHNQKTQKDIDLADKANDLTDIKDANFQKEKEQRIVEANVDRTVAETQAFWEGINSNEKIDKSIYAESNSIGPVNNPTYRSDFVKSFYGALVEGQDSQTASSVYQQSAESQMFTDIISSMVEEGYGDFQKDLKDTSIGVPQIIERMNSFDPNNNQQFYNSWLSNYNYLTGIKNKSKN